MVRQRAALRQRARGQGFGARLGAPLVARRGLARDRMRRRCHAQLPGWCAGSCGGEMMRVQIPAYTDRWMMGDRYGEVIRTKVAVLGSMSARTRLLTNNRFDHVAEIAHVRLDRS